MRNNKRAFLKWFFMVTLILAVSFSSTYSKAQSKKLVNVTIVKVTFADDTWVRASITEGGALRVDDERFGKRLFMYPVLDPLEKRAVRVRFLHGSKNDSLAIAEEVGAVNLSLAAPKVMVSHLGITIELEAVMKRLVDKKSDTFQTALKPPQMGIDGGNCCVWCNGRQYCSNCSVQTSCGCCNTADCPGECN